MNRQQVSENLVNAFERGYIDDDVLVGDPVESLSAPSPAASAGVSAPLLSNKDSAADSSKLLSESIHFLTDTTKQPISALASFDGGLEISFFGTWSTTITEDVFLDILRPLKEKAREQAGLIPLLIDDVGFMVYPDGAKSGFSYTYKLTVLEDNRIKYWFLVHTSPRDSIPGVRVKCDYQAFRGRTLADVNREIKHILDVIGFKITRETLSRVDFNITVNRSIDDFSAAYNDGLILNRCGVSIYGRKNRIESYRFGKNGGSLSMSVYDKTKELCDRYDPEKIDDIAAVFGSDIQDLTRYEFRLSRDFLNANEIDTIDDLLASFVGIVDYLTLGWFLVKDKSENSHKKRQELKIAPFWREVRSVFLIYAITGRNLITTQNLIDNDFTSDAVNKHYRTFVRRRPLRRFRRKLKSLFNIGLGCFVSAVALALPPDSTISPVQFQKTITRYASFFSDDCYKSFQERRLKFSDLEVKHGDLAVYSVPVRDLLGDKING